MLKGNPFTQLYSCNYRLDGAFNCNNVHRMPFERCKMQNKYLKTSNSTSASNLVKMINNLLLLSQLRVQFKILLVFIFFCTLGNKIDTACCIFWQLEKWVLMLSKLFLHDQTASCSTMFTLVRKEKNRTEFQHFSRSGGGDRMWLAN